MAYTAVIVEGGLFPADLLEQIAEGAVEGQRPEDFGLGGGQRLSDEIQGAFSDARAFWDAFQHRLIHSRESTTTITRDAWVLPLLERLGFRLVFQPSAAVAGNERYAISHRAGEDPDAPPVHIVSVEQPLDRREGSRRSPHALVQEYLNRTDALWGIVTNGERLRLLRDTSRLARPTYLEFDLRALVEGNLYSEFVLLYRLLHRSRFPTGSADAPHCMLERYYQCGIDQGGRVRERLREGVEQALRTLGQAFLDHPDSGELRRALASGRLEAAGYYRQLLRLVYRLLFLMVVEERRLLFPPDAGPAAGHEVYLRYYSVSQLRDRCERRAPENRFSDLWQGLLQTFRLFRDAAAAAALGLRPLDGELFGPEGCPDLEGAGCDNAALLRALYHLSTFEDTGEGEGRGRGRVRRSGVRRRVNYAALDVEELGSVYESLLDYHPQVTLAPAPHFELVPGSDRKTTGSYYTPPDLVHELIQSALVPVMEERLKAAKTREDKERALLDLRVCDPAAGSGHFLLAAARRIARELAKVRSGEAEPPPEVYRAALRDVIRQCLYAVDKNPLAVDLCKVALWLEGHNAGLPLSFLDHHVKCGDSLVGVFALDVLAQGIPDEAYTPVTGDDKAVAAAVRKRNKQEREGQHGFDALLGSAPEMPAELAREFAALAAGEDRTPDDVQTRQLLYEELRARGGRWWTYKVACDLWTAAFFMPLRRAEGARPDLVPTTDTVRRFLAHPSAVHAQVVGEAMALAERLRFFHWPLEFPDAFARGGFDVVLGNPPWERIKLQEQEFFATRDPEIARAPTKAAREQLIEALPKRKPALAREFAQAKRDAEAQSAFVRASGRFPLCGRGDVNTYSVFAELMRALLAPAGRAGLIVPSGIATDDTTKHFFQNLMDHRSLASLYDFENREGLFPAVDSRMKFCLLTLTGAERPAGEAEFAFFLHRVEELRDPARRFILTAADMALFNPNTRTCPIFRTRRDAELARRIYRRAGVLVREPRDGDPGDNPWGVSFLRMFDMANDSGLFRTKEQLEAEEWELRGNVFVRGGKRYLPLYEAKLFHQFDHRFATFARQSPQEVRAGNARELTAEEHASPTTLVLPRYWVPEEAVITRVVKDMTGKQMISAEREREREHLSHSPLSSGLSTIRTGNRLSDHHLEHNTSGRSGRNRVNHQTSIGWLFAYREIARATDERTGIAAVIPPIALGHTASLLRPLLMSGE